MEGWLHKEVAFKTKRRVGSVASRKGHIATKHQYTARYVRLVAPVSPESAVGEGEREGEAALMEPTIFFYKVLPLLTFH